MITPRPWYDATGTVVSDGAISREHSRITGRKRARKLQCPECKRIYPSARAMIAAGGHCSTAYQRHQAIEL